MMRWIRNRLRPDSNARPNATEKSGEGQEPVKYGLKLKFSFMIAGMIIVVGGSLGGYALYTSRQVLEEELVTKGISTIMGLAFSSKFGILSEDPVTLRNIMEAALKGEHVEYIRIYDRNRSILSERYNVGEEHHSTLGPVTSEEFDGVNKQLLIKRMTKSNSGETEYFYRLLAPVDLNTAESQGTDSALARMFDLPAAPGGKVQIGYVELGVNEDTIKSKLTELIRFYSILTLGVVTLGIALSILFVGRLLRPVKGMIEMALLISRGDLTRSVEFFSRDELGDLARIFNQMTVSLRERDAQLQQQFQALESAHADFRQTTMELEIYKDNLEQKVQERTEELAMKNVELMAAMEKAQESDRLKTRFLASMSHELRTPLNAIIGFAQVILEGIDGEITEVQHKDVTAIQQSGAHLLEMINDILDIAKIEAGQMTLSPEETRIEEVIRSVISSAKGLVKMKEIELQYEIEEGLPPIQADPMRLRQVLLNLVSNAVKFTAKGWIRIKVVQDLKTLKVSVSDTGIGIRQEDLPKLFREFRQLDASTTRNRGGTGLGLSIAKQFVELHGGEIWAESRFGVGSTFSFRLPLRPSGQTTLPAGRQSVTMKSSRSGD